jgi:hypothetical protein
VLAALRKHPLGAEAAIIGRVEATQPGMVLLNTLGDRGRSGDGLRRRPHPRHRRTGDVVLLNKVDLLPCLDFSVDRFLSHLRQVNPHAPVHQVSARTAEGLSDWYAWLSS